LGIGADFGSTSHLQPPGVALRRIEAVAPGILSSVGASRCFPPLLFVGQTDGGDDGEAAIGAYLVQAIEEDGEAALLLPFKEAMRQAQLGGALEVPVEALPEVAAFKVLAVFKGAIEDGQQAGVGLG